MHSRVISSLCFSILFWQNLFALPLSAQSQSFIDKLKAGDLAVSTHDFEQGINLYNEARDIGQSENDKYEMSESSRKIAVAYAGAARYDEAIASFNQSIAEATDLKDAKVMRTSIFSKFGLAKMYSMKGHAEPAWVHL